MKTKTFYMVLIFVAVAGIASTIALMSYTVRLYQHGSIISIIANSR